MQLVQQHRRKKKRVRLQFKQKLREFERMNFGDEEKSISSKNNRRECKKFSQKQKTCQKQHQMQ